MTRRKMARERIVGLAWGQEKFRMDESPRSKCVSRSFLGGKTERHKDQNTEDGWDQWKTMNELRFARQRTLMASLPQACELVPIGPERYRWSPRLETMHSLPHWIECH